MFQKRWRFLYFITRSTCRRHCYALRVAEGALFRKLKIFVCVNGAGRLLPLKGGGAGSTVFILQVDSYGGAAQSSPDARVGGSLPGAE